MKNKEIRISIIEAGLTYRKLASALGIRPESLSRKLRNEIPSEEKDKMLKVIKSISV